MSTFVLQTQKDMPKYTKDKQEELIEKAKQLWLKDIEPDMIAQVLGVAQSTIEKWARERSFEQNKRSQIMALSSLRNYVLESCAAVINGETPLLTPEQASKYAAAFEKFSDNKKVLIYMYEAFEMLSDQYTRNIQACKTNTSKEIALEQLKVLRKNMDTVINNINKEVLGDD